MTDMDKTHNILIIGAGQLGSRHLQAIKQADIKMNIFVVDNYITALENAKIRYNEIPENKNIVNINFTTDLDTIPQIIDFCLIATTATRRAEIIQNVVGGRQIKSMVIEKVLFQNIDDYYSTSELLKLNNINAWVNCPRRMQTFYKDVAKELFGEKINMIVEGTNWGLACNAIHFIDLIAFLTGCKEYYIQEDIDKDIIKSKRSGYIEFTGSLQVNLKNGSQCVLTSRKGEVSTPPIMIITSETSIFIINETKQEAYIARKKNNYEWENINIELKYQSGLTSKVLTTIINTGTCDLTPYKESMELHLTFIAEILNFLNTNYQKGITTCPIT